METERLEIESDYLANELPIDKNQIIKKASLAKILIFLFISNLLFYSYYFIVDDISLFRNSEFLNTGIFFYLIQIALTFLFFINSKNSFVFFFSLKKENLITGIKVFCLSVLVMSVIEIALFNEIRILNIFESKTISKIVRELGFGLSVAFTEELVFRLVLLTQVLLYIGDSKIGRISASVITSTLFTLSHISLQLHVVKAIDWSHLLVIFIFSYFISILYIKQKNFILVFFLHFFVNISAVFIDNKGYYLLFGTLLIAIYTIPFISNSKLFKVNKIKTTHNNGEHP